MKLKKIMLIGIILFAILTIGAVSASQDLNSSDVFTSDELGEEVVQDDSSDVLGDVEVKDGENEIEDEPLIFDSTDAECYVGLYLQPDSKGTLTVSVDGKQAKLNVIGDSEEDEDDDFIITVNDGSKTQAIIYGEDYENSDNSAISNYASEDWSISFAKLAPGDHTIFIKFVDSRKNDPAYNLEKTFNITMIAGEEEELEIDIDPYYGKNESNRIEFGSLDDSQISNLTVFIDGVSRNIVNRAIDLSALDLGKHTIVIYNGNKVAVNTTFTIVVGIITGPKEDSFIYNANKVISLSLPQSAKGNLIITINNGEIDPIPLVNGSASYSLSNLGVGAYDIYADYDGGEFEVTPYEHYIEIYPIIVCPSKMTVGEKKYITFEANANTRGTFDVEVDWKTYASVTIVNGKASILLDMIDDGDVEITARYSSLDADVYSVEQFFEMEVASVEPKIYAPNIKMTYLQNVVMDVKVFGTNGRLAEEDEDVEIEIGNNYYYDPSIGKNGIAKQKINVPPGKYTVKIYYGDTIIKRTLVVYHALKMSNVKVKKSAKKLVLKATLKVGKKAIKGKKVTFKFNGKKFKAKTNSKGVAKVTVNKKYLQKLKVGKKVKIQATYLKDTVKKSVKVKK